MKFSRIYIFLTALTFAVFAILLFVARSNKAQAPVNTDCGPEFYASKAFVVSAIRVETEAIKELAPPTASCLSGGIEYFMGEFNGYTFVYFTTPEYGVEATKYVEYTFTTFHPAFLVFSGIGGRLNPIYEIGTTLIPTHWIQLETGKSIAIRPEMLKVLGTMNDLNVVENGVTALEFVTNGDVVFASTGSTIVDMESYNFAEVAGSYNTPFIAIRSISDGADGQRDHDKYVVASQASAHVALRFVSMYYENQTP